MHKLDQQELDIQYVLNTKRVCPTDYTDKLLFWFTKSQLIEIISSYLFYLKDADVTTTKASIEQYDSYTLATTITNTKKILNEKDLEVLDMMVKRVKNNKGAISPSIMYVKKLEQETFSK